MVIVVIVGVVVVVILCINSNCTILFYNSSYKGTVRTVHINKIYLFFFIYNLYDIQNKIKNDYDNYIK